MLKQVYRPGGSANCPLCKEPLSREASVCPHCQRDLSENEEWKAIQTKEDSGCSMMLLLGLGVVLGAGGWLASLAG
ncbi:MAG: hypothetical protein P1U85_02450 [Verrucomicrobiales bacterium]|nr:hypothetical protein [Verrucomicrobiales bacterium]